jgi:hypothetical protein
MSDVLPSLGQRLATTREEVPMMASEPVKMCAYAALAQARIEAGVPKVSIPCAMAAPHSSRWMQRPITRSCMVVVVVKPIVRRTRRVMRVRTCTGALFSHAYRQAVCGTWPAVLLHCPPSCPLLCQDDQRAVVLRDVWLAPARALGGREASLRATMSRLFDKETAALSSGRLLSPLIEVSTAGVLLYVSERPSHDATFRCTDSVDQHDSGN